MATQLDNDLSQDDGYFQHALPNYYRAVLKKFRKISRSFIHFNILFLFLFLSEIVVFASLFPVVNYSMLFALSLSVLFVTCFTYLVLLFYFQTRKPEQLIAIREDFLASCKRLLSIPEGMSQHHLSIAEALSRLSSYLEDFEKDFYKTPSFLQLCAPWISRFSAYCYAEDVFKMKQMLLSAAVYEHIKQIRVTPTDLEVHASLGGTYVALAKLYKDFIPKGQKAILEEKSNAYSKLAIEEFKILSHYASDDPWVHEQMAMGYRDLNLPIEEIKETEILLKLRPQDKEILFRLGFLYFSQGLNAKGLQSYEELKKTNFKKAEDLISSYGIL